MSSEFIPVSERLPDNDLSRRYLVLTGGHYHEIAVYSTRSPGKWFESNRDISEWVTHWMVLPEAPPDGFNNWLADRMANPDRKR